MKTLILSALMITFCSCASFDGSRVVLKPSDLNAYPSHMIPASYEADKDGSNNQGVNVFRVEVERTLPDLDGLDLADLF